MTRAVVFAYHKVGVRCLKVLLAHGIDVPLVVTHEDSPGETIWFDSVAATAAEYGIAVRTPADPNTAELAREIAALAPDFLFSFYYRRMLKAPLLALPARGALNVHGSLLPKYRGRADGDAVLGGGRRDRVEPDRLARAVGVRHDERNLDPVREQHLQAADADLVVGEDDGAGHVGSVRR